MANLKIDLLNKLQNEKYYEELELVRLAQDPNTNYKNKIDAMSGNLKNIAILNAEIGLVDQYFQEQAPVAQQAPQPQAQVHPGQTHGE